MKVKYRTNLCAGIVSVIFGLAVLWLIPAQIGTEYSSGNSLTSRAVPGGAAILFIVCGAALIVQSLILKKDTVRELNLAKEGKAFLYMAVFGIYVILFDYSFIVASIFLGAATLLFTRSKKKLYYIIVIITVFVLYLLFTQVLHVRLK